VTVSEGAGIGDAVSPGKAVSVSSGRAAALGRLCAVGAEITPGRLQAREAMIRKSDDNMIFFMDLFYNLFFILSSCKSFVRLPVKIVDVGYF